MEKNNEISKKDKFKFEREGMDFPFYNDNPHLTPFKWTVMLLIIFSSVLMLFVDVGISGTVFLYYILPVIGFGYVSDWNYRLIVKKLRKRDIILILAVLVISLIYALSTAAFLEYFGIVATDNPIFEYLDSVFFWILLAIGVFIEELFNIIVFLLMLFISYKITNNRKISIITGVLVTCIIFGLLHYTAYYNLIYILVVIGLGTIFPMYAYIKSKNILITIIIHFLYNAIISLYNLFFF